MTYTQKGWFFLCPIYLDMTNEDCPVVDARFQWLEWWHDVNLWFFGVLTGMILMVNPEHEPMFPLRITGEI